MAHQLVYYLPFVSVINPTRGSVRQSIVLNELRNNNGLGKGSAFNVVSAFKEIQQHFWFYHVDFGSVVGQSN